MKTIAAKAQTISSVSAKAPLTKTHYWIKCSDGGMLTIGEDRLEDFLDKMPVLRSLLFGHPQMAPRELGIRPDDGAKILEIPPNLAVCKRSFLLLLQCALDLKPLPPRNAKGQLLALEEAIAVLGGCQDLEARLYNHQPNANYNPLTPAEDVECLYYWKVVSTTSSIPICEAQVLETGGFSLASDRPMLPHSPCVHYYYRKEKGDYHAQTDNGDY